MTLNVLPDSTGPTLSPFTFGQTVGYNSGSASATSIDVADLSSANGSPTAYYIGASGTSTTGTTSGGGSVSISSAGVASYTPKVGLRGSDTFQVMASNASGTSSPATVTVTVGDPTLTFKVVGTGAKVDAPLSGYSIEISGGQAPYTCATTLVSGALKPGVSLTSACALTGTPADFGSATFSVSVTDSSVNASGGANGFTQASGNLTMTVAKPDVPVLKSFTLDGTLAYNALAVPRTSIDVAALGLVSGKPTYYYVGSSGNLFSTSAGGGDVASTRNGIVYYTPPVGVRGTDTIQVIGANYSGDSLPVTVTVKIGDPTLAISLSGSGAMQNTALSGYKIATTGGKGPYTCSTTPASGSLPTGVSLTSTCDLTGAPSVTGTFPFTVTVTDSSINSSGGANGFTQTSGSLSLTVGMPELMTKVNVPTQTLAANSTDGLPFTPVTGSGGTGTLTYEISPDLPSGLSFDKATGAISGTPKTALASKSFTVTVTDQTAPKAQTSSKPFSLVVNAPALNTTLAQATVTATSGTALPAVTPVTASGGLGSVTYKVSPDLPAGLTLNPSTGEITGTPSAPLAATPFTVTATDSTTPTPQTSAKIFTLTVNQSTQTITLVSPANIVYRPGVTVTLSVTASSGLPVTLTSRTPGVCSISGTIATFLAAGTCTIKASQAGDASHAAAPDVTVSFGAVSAPVISATGTVSPSTFSAAGTQLTFTVTLTNTGGVPAGGLTLTDGRIGTFKCSAATIPVGGSVTCTGTTFSTAADIAAGSISLSPKAIITYSNPGPSPASSAPLHKAAPGGRVAKPAPAPASITVTIPVSLTATAMVDVAKVTQATRSAIRGLLSERANLITSHGPDTTRFHGRLAGTLFADDTGEDEEGTVDAGQYRPRQGFTGSPVGRGMGFSGFGGSVGAGSINEPAFGMPGFGYGRGGRSDGGAGLFGRFGGPLGSGLGVPDDDRTGLADRRMGPAGFGFSGDADDVMGRFAFSSSLSQMREAAAAADSEKRARALAAGDLGPSVAGFRAPSGGGALGVAGNGASSAYKPLPFDIWVEGTTSYFTNDSVGDKRHGHSGIVATGADAVVMPGLLIGAMAQFDWVGDSSSVDGTSRSGRGWMVGPYASARLTRNVFFDARALWGRSSNEVDPLGIYTDSFSTSRALVSAKLTGDWKSGALTFRPSAEAVWYSEWQDAYVNAIGIGIDGQTFNLGRAQFGPEVGYRLNVAGSVVEPFVGLKGVWDFSRTKDLTAAGEPVSPDSFHGRVEAGLMLRTTDGISLRTTGAYDGLGSNSGYQAVQGQLQLSIPLQ